MKFIAIVTLAMSLTGCLSSTEIWGTPCRCDGRIVCWDCGRNTPDQISMNKTWDSFTKGETR